MLSLRENGCQPGLAAVLQRRLHAQDHLSQLGIVCIHPFHQHFHFPPQIASMAAASSR
jgi:hypothetical protein